MSATHQGLHSTSTTLSTLSALFTTGSFVSPTTAASPVNEADIIWIKNPRGKTYYKSQYLGKGASAKVYEVNDVLLNEEVSESDASCKYKIEAVTAKVIGKYACKIIDKPKQKSHYFAYMSPGRSATDIQNMNIDFNERIHNEIRIHREIENNKRIYANISGGTGSRYIVNFIDHFEDRNFIYIIFELCQKSLQDLINMNYFTVPSIDGTDGAISPVPGNNLDKSYSDDTISIARSSQNSDSSDSSTLPGQKNENPEKPATRAFKVKYYFLQLMTGVDYLHSIDIIHGDLKPQNLLITFNGAAGCDRTADSGGTIKITDFGLAVRSGERLLGYGTANFIAPEILTHSIHKKYQEKIDIWACGIILYNMMFKGFPFDPITGGKNPTGTGSKSRKVSKTTSTEDLFANIIKCDLQTPTAASAEYDDLILLSIIKKILQRDPIDRPSAKEILGFLANHF